MSTSSSLTKIVAFVDRYCLCLLLVCYAVAAFWPGLGLWIRDVSFGSTNFTGHSAKVTLPMVMLALLLLNAGLGIRRSQLTGWRRVTLLLLLGLLANIVVPVVFVLAATGATRLWLDPEEVQSILVGLAIVAAMPIAGSSTAWSQNVNGDMTVSLGLVAISTVLSPLTTPFVFSCLRLAARPDTAHLLQRIAAEGAETFLIVCVVVPSLVGGALAMAVGEMRLKTAKPYLKLFNWVNLLLLVYANAAVTLPEAIAFPDLDFLLTSLAIAVVLCVLMFGSGWTVGRFYGADLTQQSSLMFGLGMNNNGAGMVLASLTIADHPRVMLPIITYNLVQHLVAGGMATLIRRERSEVEMEKGAAQE